jgi:hypothetical protein
MPEAVEQTLVIVVTLPRPVTKELRAAVRDELQANLPSYVLVVILDAGMTADAFPMSQRQNATSLIELAQDDTQAKILTELKALRAELSAQHERMNVLGLRVVTE